MNGVESTNEIIKKQLTELLNKANAHATFEDAVAGLLIENAGNKPANVPYSIWQLIEHIRIAQWDILEFSKDARHQSPQWPDEYWPKETVPESNEVLLTAIQQVKKDKEKFIEMINAPAADLYTPFTYGSGQNLFREALLIADHNAYHTGQIIIIRKLLGDWK